MAGSFEQLIIIGNVGNDAEKRFTNNGTPVATFSLAVTSRWKDGTTNEPRERTRWYRVSCWRGLADVVEQYVKKGMSVMVSGTVDANAYMGNDGQPRASLDVTAQNVQFLTRPNDGQDNQGTSGNPGQYSDQSPAAPEEMDDIPF